VRTADAMPAWVPVTLKFAAVYNLAWGLFVVLFPSVPFGWLGLDAPNYPSIVQCLGMVIGVYGIGYWIAARDAATHWPIVLVGLLGKVFGPIGFVYTASLGDLPWRMGATILTNDIAWWLPFTAILIHAARIHEAKRSSTENITLEQSLRSAVIPNGTNLYELSFQSPLMLVCVRHFGCTFCREALADLARQKHDVDLAGLTPVIISMGSDEQAAPVLARYGLSHVIHVSDPERHLYRSLELPFGTLSQLISGTTIWRAVVEGTVFRFGFGRMVGNGLQLSGAFLVKNGRVERAIRHRSSSERTDFVNLCASESC
jgi:uncharacterized membrane protein HdeD (DUF308 family)